MRGGGEMREDAVVVERKVWRRDDGDGVGARLRRMRGERDRVGGRLRAGVDRDLELSARRLDEELRNALPLRDREEEAFPGRSEREQPVEPARGEEVDVGRASDVVARGRECGGERSAKHRVSLW